MGNFLPLKLIIFVWSVVYHFVMWLYGENGTVSLFLVRQRVNSSGPEAVKPFALALHLHVIHLTKKWICIKFSQCKDIANICLLQSKPVANVVKATFATISTLICKYDSKSGLSHFCYNFALEERYVCNTFALCKFYFVIVTNK